MNQRLYQHVENEQASDSKEEPKPRPLILAFVSGKGGVGKTMLAMACATEISKYRKVLVIDLDFFNRGLTALLHTYNVYKPIAAPRFLVSDDASATRDNWVIAQTQKNFFFIPCPESDQTEMSLYVTMDVQILEKCLEDFVLQAARETGSDCIVLDCHGGPDNTSFAACFLADYSFLISEPDKITFSGTLHFKRQLDRIYEHRRQPDIRLVFNKVVPAFSALFIKRIYRKYIRSEFRGNDLLATFPLEIYLTKEFEKTPFLTSAFPNSLLCRKIQVMLFDLLKQSRSDLVPPLIAHTFKFERSIIRMSLGKTPVLLDTDAVLPAIAGLFLTLSALNLLFVFLFGDETKNLKAQVKKLESVLVYEVDSSWLSSDNVEARKFVIGEQAYGGSFPDYSQLNKAYDTFNNAYYKMSFKQRFYFVREHKFNIANDEEIRNRVDQIQKNLREVGAIRVMYSDLFDEDTIFAYAGIGTLVWFFVAVFVKWTTWLDRRSTYFLRQGRWIRAGIFYVANTIMWGFPTVILAAIIQSNKESALLIAASGLTLLIIFVIPLAKTIRILRFDHRLGESIFKFVLLSLQFSTIPIILFSK